MKMPDKSKRYLLFGGAQYYPGGGFYDFLGSYETVEEAKQNAESEPFSIENDIYWFHIVDRNTLEIVYDNDLY